MGYFSFQQWGHEEEEEEVGSISCFSEHEALSLIPPVQQYCFTILVRDTVVGIGCKDSGSLLYEKHYVWSEGQRPTSSCPRVCYWVSLWVGELVRKTEVRIEIDREWELYCKIHINWDTWLMTLWWPQAFLALNHQASLWIILQTVYFYIRPCQMTGL